MAKKIAPSLLSFDMNEYSDESINGQDGNIEPNLQINFAQSPNAPAHLFRPADPEKLITFMNKLYMDKYPDIQCYIENEIDEHDNESYDYLFSSNVKPEWEELRKAVSILTTKFFNRTPYSIMKYLDKKQNNRNSDYIVNLKTNNNFSLAIMEKFTRRIVKTYISFHRREIFLEKNLGRIKSMITSNAGLEEIEKQLLTAIPILENVILVFNEMRYLNIFLTLKTKKNHHGKSLDELTDSTKLWVSKITGSGATKLSEILSTTNHPVHTAIMKIIETINKYSNDISKRIPSFRILSECYSLMIGKKNSEREITKTLALYKIILDETYWSYKENN